MMGGRSKSIAAMGEVNQVHTWSGIPYHFLQAARARGFANQGIDVDTSKERLPRILWNLKELGFGRKGGYQYSPWHLSRLESQLSQEVFQSDILTFNQHFPRFKTIRPHGGTLSHYIDAPFASLVRGQGLELKLPARTIERAMGIEEENFMGSQRVITMARWAAEAVKEHYPSVDRDKIHILLPGANLELPDDWEYRAPELRASPAYDLVLGFVGKDWERKGLSLLMELQAELKKRGYRVLLRVAGNAPALLKGRPDVEFSGFIDKQHHAKAFADFVASCDIGCLFSRCEALGISTLEFLRIGVPVAGFLHEGPADTLPASASLRFHLNDTLEAISDGFERFIVDERYAQALRQRAIELSPLVTWDRCVREMENLWENRPFEPVKLWEL